MSSRTLLAGVLSLFLFGVAGFLGYQHWTKPIDPDNGNWAKADEDENLTGRAAELAKLGELGAKAKPEDVTTLLTALKESDAALRGEAALALGKVGPLSPQIREALAAGVKDADPSVRSSSLISIDAQSRATKDAADPIFAQYETIVIGALSDPTPRVRRIAAMTLRDRPEGTMINVEAITKAELAALSDIDQSTKIAVVGALQDLPKNAGAKLDDASVTAIALEIPKIVKTLAEADMRSRPEYQGLIRKLGPAIASAKTPPADAQTAAIRDAVKAALADPEADARKGVLEVLPALTAIAGREAAAVELLRPLLKDADPNIRAVAFTTLWSSPATVQAGGDALKAELKEISKGWVADLAKPEIPVRESAAWALCWTSPEDADAALAALRAVKDEPNAGVKRRVAKAIESLEAAKASASWPEPSWPPFRSGPPPQVPAAGGAGGGGPPG